jgi:hypothetical protein
MAPLPTAGRRPPTVGGYPVLNEAMRRTAKQEVEYELDFGASSPMKVSSSAVAKPGSLIR